MSYSVLVVDDEELTLRTVSRGLREEGFDVSTANCGEHALEVFADEKPDLTLLDIVMPGMDGVEVLRQIKQSNPAAIVLMMSAYHMVDRAVEAMKLGAYDYMVKPFHLADMIATLHRASEMLALRVRVRDNVERAKGRYDFGRVVTQNPDTRRIESGRIGAHHDPYSGRERHRQRRSGQGHSLC
jgi:two-component system response regulator AtoC